MAVIVEFIKSYAPWIYGACALIALWYLRIAVVARRERRYAVFSLEREAALNRTYGAWSVAFGLMMIMGLTYFLSTTVATAVQPLVMDDRTPTPAMLTRVGPSPTLPLPETTPTAEETVDAQAAPTTTPSKSKPTTQPTATQAPTPTAAPTATAAPAIQAPACSDGGAVISSPGMNAQVTGMVPIFGTAANANFKYYKLEFGVGANPSVWSYFDGGEHPVQGGRLGTLNAGALAPGTYSVRVVVVDASGNYPKPCQTVITVK